MMDSVTMVSRSTAVRAVRHTLWAISCCTAELDIISLPGDGDIDEMLLSMPTAVRNAMMGQRWYGMIDGTHIRMGAKNFSCSKKYETLQKAHYCVQNNKVRPRSTSQSVQHSILLLLT